MPGRVVVFREIVDPDPGLLAWLDARDQAMEVEDQKGNTHIFIEDGIPRESEVTEMIVGRGAGPGKQPLAGCTKGFGLFVEEEDGGYEGPLATFAREDTARKKAGELSALQKAEQAASTAKVTLSAEIVGVEQSGWGSLAGGEPVEDDGSSDSKRSR